MRFFSYICYMLWIWSSIISACLLGFYDVFKKQALKKNGVLEVIAVSSAFTALFLSPFLSQGTPHDHLCLIIKSLIVSFSWITGLAALARIPLTTASSLKATRPVLVVIFSLILFGERLNLGQWAGVVIVIASLFFLARVSKTEDVAFSSSRGVFYMLLSIISGAASALWDKHIMQSMEPLFVQSWTNVYITLVLAIAILVRRGMSEENRIPLRWDWNLLVIAVIITLSDALYFNALAQEDSLLSVISLLRRCGVIVTFVAGAILYKEKKIRSKAIVLTFLMAGLTILAMSS